MVRATQLGQSTGLQVRVQLLPPSVHHQPGLAWGKLSLCVDGQPIWGGGDAAQALEWTLVDLLQGLARIWPWLLLEEGNPLPLSPEHPGLLMEQAHIRWADMPPAEAEAEADLLYDFRQRHDLSLLLRGIKTPALWLLKEGHECIVWSPALQGAVRLPHAQVMQTLTELGDLLAQGIRDSTHPRAHTAIARWDNRLQAAQQHYLSIVTGLSSDELHMIAHASTVASFFELAANDVPQVEPNELLMAARMTRGYISLSDQRVLLEHIKSIDSTAEATKNMDALSAAAPALEPGHTPYDQAYALANWLRKALKTSPDTPIHPEEILTRWAVSIQAVMLAPQIDAVAVWGKQRGPCILLNSNPSARASSKNGKRTTLAHEICHLLVDRTRALPVAEVLGGQAPKRAEQRANAFAAELLLPRSQAAQACESHESLLEAAAYLENHFQVSREVVCNQINNSEFSAHLDNTARRQLNNWKLETRLLSRTGSAHAYNLPAS